MQHHAADHLHVEVTEAEGPLGSLAHSGEGGNKEIVQGLAAGQLGAELGGEAPQFFVRQLGVVRFQRVDRRHPLGVIRDLPVIGRAEHGLGQLLQSEHVIRILLRSRDRRFQGTSSQVGGQEQLPEQGAVQSTDQRLG